MTESFDFAITKKRLIFLLGCLFFSGLLLYAAGIVTGMLVKPGVPLRSSKMVVPERQKSASEQRDAPIRKLVSFRFCISSTRNRKSFFRGTE